MSRTLSDLTDSVGDVVSSGTTALGDLATTAVARTGDLATTAFEHVVEVPERLGDLARDRFAPPPRRSRTPWLLLVLVAAATAGVVWWLRRDTSVPSTASRPTPSGVPDDDRQTTSAIPS